MYSQSTKKFFLLKNNDCRKPIFFLGSRDFRTTPYNRAARFGRGVFRRPLKSVNGFGWVSDRRRRCRRRRIKTTPHNTRRGHADDSDERRRDLETAHGLLPVNRDSRDARVSVVFVVGADPWRFVMKLYTMIFRTRSKG